jgi:transcriptional regulator with XRE-family HTH domain
MLLMRTETTGERLSRLRVERGYSQRELAKVIGIGHTLISDYETGRLRLNDEILTKLCKALDISSDVLLGLQASEKTNDTGRLRLMKRMRQIEELPEHKKKAILKTLDDLIRANS